MGTKNAVWVCWQEPAVDCGKISQVPHSWISEVLIGDGRAPGSVLKCRWPKTKRQYTAKVIAPPTGPQDRIKMNILTILDGVSVSSGDDETPSKLDDSSNAGSSKHGVDGLESVGQSVVPNLAARRGRPPSHKRTIPSLSHSAAVQNSDIDGEDDLDQRPPFLSPQINFMNRRQHAAASSPSLQQWFVQQLAQLKSDLVSNFDQINHKITAMDLSIRSIRDRVDRMDEKLDMTLIALGSTPEMDRDAWEQQWLNQGATSHDVEDQPPSLKRQRTMEMENCSVGDDDTQGRNGERRSLNAYSAAGPSARGLLPAPLRNAKKSIVHRAPPISPPPCLDKEPVARGSSHVDRPAPTPRFPSMATRTSERRGKSDLDMVVQYKPGSGNQVIILGGDPNYEIGKEIYAEALENVYEESPIYLILSLLRRLFCDQDLARLWFKGESTTQSDMYVLRSTFKEALMNQALMQYPEGTLSEREYATKLHQAMYDAKHRIKRGKGTTSRAESYFSLDMVGMQVSPNGVPPSPSSSGYGNDRDGNLISAAAVAKVESSDEDLEDFQMELNGSGKLRDQLISSVKKEVDDTRRSTHRLDHDGAVSNSMETLAP